MMEKVYATVADVLWENKAPDVLVARLSDRLQAVDPDFSAARFTNRAYWM